MSSRRLLFRVKYILPLSHSLQALWVFRTLNAANNVIKILAAISAGREAEHLRALVNIVDLRGSDLRLDSGSVCEGSRRAVPYPAVVWDWRCVQSYIRTTEQHINVLELVAFLNYSKCMTAYSSNHNHRFFHVLDSRVCSCVLAKGSSSSKVLNRSLRRVCSLL